MQMRIFYLALNKGDFVLNGCGQTLCHGRKIIVRVLDDWCQKGCRQRAGMCWLDGRRRLGFYVGLFEIRTGQTGQSIQCWADQMV